MNPDEMDEVRIDKFLWSIRCFKTRNEATVACNGGKVKLNGADAKPSKLVRSGDTIVVRKGIMQLSYKVIQPVEKRQGASSVSLYAENLTPQSEYDKLRSPRESFFFRRDPGTGRPTKKDRRQMDDVLSEFDSQWDFADEDADDCEDF